MVDDRRLREISGGGIGALAPGFIPERDEYVFIRFSTGLLTGAEKSMAI